MPQQVTLPADDRALVDALHVTTFLTISKSTLDRLVRRGQLARVKIGRASRYRAGDIRALATAPMAEAWA